LRGNPLRRNESRLRLIFGGSLFSALTIDPFVWLSVA